MYPGFLPFSRATLMMDVVCLAMAVVLPALGYSIHCARKGAYNKHRMINSIIGLALLVTVILFEVEVRLYGWRQQASISPYFGTPLNSILAVHIFFSVSATISLILTFSGAFKNVAKRNGGIGYIQSYSKKHVLLGKMSALLLVCTTITGTIFYYMAFVA